MSRHRPRRRSRPTPQRGDWYEVAPGPQGGGVAAAKGPAPGDEEAVEPTRTAPNGPDRASTVPPTASARGGASGTEDTTRAAGYVVDLSAPQASPPGPPVATDPALLAPPEAPPPPPGRRRRAAPPSPSSAGDDAKEKPSFDDLALARLEGESPAPAPPPDRR